MLNPLQLNLQPEAAPMDFSLIKRYLELNPYKSLQVVDPQSYDNTKSLYENRTEKNLSQLSHTIESHGILLQLFSRFITEASMSQLHGSNSYIKLDEVIQYIHKNLDKRITVIELSERMCLTLTISRKYSKDNRCASLRIHPDETYRTGTSHADLFETQYHADSGMCRHL